MRKESRGSHFREDFPEQNDADWSVNILHQMVEGVLKQTTSTIGMK
jgi:succinate dehydrogenase/fumarate reductase flavoprotein subunit